MSELQKCRALHDVVISICRDLSDLYHSTQREPICNNISLQLQNIDLFMYKKSILKGFIQCVIPENRAYDMQCTNYHDSFSKLYSLFCDNYKDIASGDIGSKYPDVIVPAYFDPDKLEPENCMEADRLMRNMIQTAEDIVYFADILSNIQSKKLEGRHTISPISVADGGLFPGDKSDRLGKQQQLSVDQKGKLQK